MYTFARTVAVWLALASIAPAAEPHAYRAARLWTGSGAPIAPAVLVVRDGKVLFAGPANSPSVPTDAVLHDLGDVTIIPGLVVAETNLADKGRDDLFTLTPHYRAADGFDPYADYSAALAGGVTTVQISPGKQRLLPGQGSVVKLAGEATRRPLRDEESLRILLGSAFKSPPSVYEPPVGAMSVAKPLTPTRPQPGNSLADAMATLRATFQAAKSNTSADPFLKAVAAAGSPSKPVRVSAPAGADLRAALSLAEEHDLKLILVEPENLAPFKERLGDWKNRVAGVVLNPGVRPGGVADVPVPGEGEPAVKSPFEMAKQLRDAGLRVAIKPQNDADLKELLYLAGLFTKYSSAADVLAMVTSDAAKLLGVGDRVGSLAAGKDADFVVLSGEPFALHTRVQSVFVDGQKVYSTEAGKASRVIRAGKIYTGQGEPIAGGALLVDGKTIRGIGADVSVPAEAEEARFDDSAVVVPGFLDLANGLGVGGPLTSASIGAKLGERLAANDPQIALARQGGVTTALLSPGGTQPAPVLAFKLGDTPRPIKDPVAIRFAVKGNLTVTGAQLREQLRSAKAYHDNLVKYEADLVEYEKKKKEYDAAKPKTSPASEKKPEEKPKDEGKKDEAKKEEPKKEEPKKEEPKGPPEPKAPTKPQTVDSLEPFRPLMAGKIPALVEARREDALRLALAIFRDELNLPMILIGADDGFRFADQLAAKNVSVIADPPFVKTVGRSDVNLPLVMSMRGVPVGFQSQATTGARYLPTAVGFAVRHGLGAEDALRSLTVSPAKFLGLDATVGSLAVGKDADLVVLSGPPFALSTRVLAVMVDGQWVYREKE